MKVSEDTVSAQFRQEIVKELRTKAQKLRAKAKVAETIAADLETWALIFEKPVKCLNKK